MFLAANSNKRSLAVELGMAEGQVVLARLVASADVVVENFSPRVFDRFGLDDLAAATPRTTVVRMPAFGSTGPWRDSVGFAQTMEQVSGLAWVTGEPEQPRVQQGPCDPLAGLHGAFAAVVSLMEREATGRGRHVELPMVEVALNAAAEQIVEWSAYGREMGREGNRSPYA